MTDVFVGHLMVDKCFDRAKKSDKHHSRKLWTKGSISPEKRIEMRARGYIAEVALCLFLGGDPVTDLHWNPKKWDGGLDYRYNGRTIDVKATDHPNAKRLMWPVKNIDKLPSAADIFVFARVLPSGRSALGHNVDLVGFVTKERFIKEHTKAICMPGLVDGTPFMNENFLDNIDGLRLHLSHQSATPTRRESHECRR